MASQLAERTKDKILVTGQASRIDIVIVNWNGGKLIRDCVQSVIDYASDAEKVIVVDNASTDKSVAELPVDPRITIIQNSVNLGFGKACNIGAAQGNADYILFLNPDAKLVDCSLENLIAFMQSSEAADIGISGARLFGDDGQTQRSCANFTNGSTYFGAAFGLTEKLPRLFTPLFATFDYSKSRYVDQAIGAYFLVRRSVFTKLNGFDERFFVYFEEVDFALRAKAVGWKSYYFAGASAYHKGGGASEQVKAARLFYTVRSRLIYAAKHFAAPSLALTVLVSLFVEPVTRIIRALGRRSLSEAGDTARAYLMVWRDMPATVRAMHQGKLKG